MTQSLKPSRQPMNAEESRAKINQAIADLHEKAFQNAAQSADMSPDEEDQQTESKLGWDNDGSRHCPNTSRTLQMPQIAEQNQQLASLSTPILRDSVNRLLRAGISRYLIVTALRQLANDLDR